MFRITITEGKGKLDTVIETRNKPSDNWVVLTNPNKREYFDVSRMVKHSALNLGKAARVRNKIPDEVIMIDVSKKPNP